MFEQNLTCGHPKAHYKIRGDWKLTDAATHAVRTKILALNRSCHTTPLHTQPPPTTKLGNQQKSPKATAATPQKRALIVHQPAKLPQPRAPKQPAPTPVPAPTAAAPAHSSPAQLKSEQSKAKQSSRNHLQTGAPKQQNRPLSAVPTRSPATSPQLPRSARADSSGPPAVPGTAGSKNLELSGAAPFQARQCQNTQYGPPGGCPLRSIAQWT